MSVAKKYSPLCFTLLSICFLFCSDYSTNYEEAEHSGRDPEIDKAIHVKWTLESVEIEDQKIDLSPYDQLKFVYEENEFWGDDGCNHFGGLYETTYDSFYAYDCWITEMACPRKQFPVNHLCRPYRANVQGNELKICSAGSIYTYRGDFVDDVEDSLFIERKWKLETTDDPNFEGAQALQLYSTVFFDENKLFTFRIQWIEEDILFYYDAYGIFGIHDDKIMFYVKGCGGRGTLPTKLGGRILRSSLYALQDGFLTLYNETYGTEYRFILES